MNTTASYEAIVLGGGKGGKSLATELGNKGVKTVSIKMDVGVKVGKMKKGKSK